MIERTIESTQTRIVDAAEERFRHYGYRKTTMSEIARDVSMSAANLYRYFENKQDIGAACVLRCFDEMESLLRAVVNNKKLPADRKLLEFTLAQLKYIYDETNNNPKINELTEMLILERSDLLHKKKQVTQSLVAEILAEGNQSGLFEVDDILTTSEAFVTAIVGFSVPIFMNLFPEEHFEKLARDVVQLTIDGIRKH
jgi:AcrR family transcriptional regulator